MMGLITVPDTSGVNIGDELYFAGAREGWLYRLYRRVVEWNPCNDFLPAIEHDHWFEVIGKTPTTLSVIQTKVERHDRTI